MTTHLSPTAGSRGIGDRYYPSYGNGGFEVATYDIQVGYSPESRELSGTTMITATATEHLSEFSLDFALDTIDVQVDGRPAAFVKDGLKVVITPAAPLPAGAGFVATVRYSGVPEKVELAGRNPWTTTPTGAVVVGMPEVSTTWFPSNDHPRNKAVYRIAITVPEGLSAISNGNLVGTSTIGGYTTWSWYEPHPMATYLTLIAIGRFQVDSGVTASGLPYFFAIAEGDDVEYALARKDIERTAEVVDWMAERFGPYPFDAIGAVVPDGDISYAPEPQTRPVYGKLMWTSGESNILTVVHENAHQWFGNSVSLDQWRDIWLSESFARYAEWLWTEDHDGKTAQQLFDGLYSEHPADDPWWRFLVGEPGAGRLFEDPLYGRGAMTLQALRNRVGEATFRQILPAWTAGRRFGNATIEDFTQHASAVAGTDLTALFDAWLFTATKPAATDENGFLSTPR